MCTFISYGDFFFQMMIKGIIQPLCNASGLKKSVAVWSIHINVFRTIVLDYVLKDATLLLSIEPNVKLKNDFIL